MVGRIIVLSGPIASGKSTLAVQLETRFDATIFKSNRLIHVHRPKVPDEREALQKAGESLDLRTKGAWVSEALVRLVADLAEDALVVVDCVRIEKQIDAIRTAFGVIVYHIHLRASDDELKRRYSSRRGHISELPKYEDVRKNRTERNIDKLSKIADTVVYTDRSTQEDVLLRAVAHLRFYPKDLVPLVDVIVGGQYGSEGKGNISAHIAPEYNYLVRVGGPNAGHMVFGDPVEKYHHLPSGTMRAPKAKLIIGPGAVLNVDGLLEEISRFSVTHDRLSIDPHAMIINKSDISYEKKYLKSISSTAQGVGAATARKINHRGRFDKNNISKVILAKDVKSLRRYIKESDAILEKAYLKNEKILLEGTQGTSLSIHHGGYPYVTSRDTSVSGCLSEAGISPKRVRRILMVCRSYPIRVGGPSGPMSQGREIFAETISERSGLDVDVIKTTEVTTTTGKPRRFAEFDWSQLRRSTVLNGATDIALTFVDYITIKNRAARRFEQLTPETINFIVEVERVSGVPVTLISTRFHFRNIIDRRAW